MFAKFLPMLEADTGTSIGGTGAEGQEVADPGSEEGAEDQEFTDPDDEEGEETLLLGEEPSEDRDLEKDAAFANMRRENQAFQSLFEQEFKGQINPYTGEEIETVNDYFEFKAQYEEDREQQEEAARMEAFEDAGIPAEYLQQMISNHPVVKKAAELAESMERASRESVFNTELENIRKLNPEIKTFEDLTKIENYDVFESMVKGGMHIDVAYRKINELKHGKTASLDTKGHLLTTDGGGTGDMSISAEQLRWYKKIMPKATEKEIRDYHAKSVKRKEK